MINNHNKLFLIIFFASLELFCSQSSINAQGVLDYLKQATPLAGFTILGEKILPTSHLSSLAKEMNISKSTLQTIQSGGFGVGCNTALHEITNQKYGLSFKHNIRWYISIIAGYGLLQFLNQTPAVKKIISKNRLSEAAGFVYCALLAASLYSQIF